MATVCISCGAENGPQDAYCWSCGVELGRTTTPDAHPDETIAEDSKTEREQAQKHVQEQPQERPADEEEDEDPVAYSSETGEDG